MTKRDYYKVLGVAKNVSGNEIKKAYRKLAMKHHPDRNPDSKDAEARFKEVKEAYEMLSDPQKRAAYDQFGHAGVDPNMGNFGAGDIIEIAPPHGATMLLPFTHAVVPTVDLAGGRVVIELPQEIEGEEP